MRRNRGHRRIIDAAKHCGRPRICFDAEYRGDIVRLSSANCRTVFVKSARYASTPFPSAWRGAVTTTTTGAVYCLRCAVRLLAHRIVAESVNSDARRGDTIMARARNDREEGKGGGEKGGGGDVAQKYRQSGYLDGIAASRLRRHYTAIIHCL